MNETPLPIHSKQPNNPPYGCLKGGNLPTYRNWLNKTTKNTNAQTITPNGVQQQSQIPLQSFLHNNTIITPNSVLQPVQQTIIPKQQSFNNMNTMSNPIHQPNEIRVNDNLKRISEVKQTMNRLHFLNNQPLAKKMKQKKIIRRTYKVGKSKILPRISVLVSNRTIRNKINTQKQLLKQVPIQEIKKYLIKRGFIRVGSITPNDILRKMYESSVLICGEIQNHNPDNLLYNFLNDDNNDK
jgi:hypothetical protein